MLSSQQLSCMPSEASASAEPCLHLPSSCLLPLHVAVQCCKVLCQGEHIQQQQTVTASECDVTLETIHKACLAHYCLCHLKGRVIVTAITTTAKLALP